uniref:TCF3 (E2A) fusion partner (In childhood Leukemia) n=1 Tax=Callorhinchus milii TaxID=7868 RepID=V9LF29_CALMI
MAGESFDYSGCCSELPPLFEGNILEQEVVFAGPEPEGREGRGERERRRERAAEMYRRKYHKLQHRCRDIETVNERILNRLHRVRKITDRLQRDRRCLMTALDEYCDNYHNAELTIAVEEETAVDEGQSPSNPEGSVPPPPSEGRRRRGPRDLQEPEERLRTVSPSSRSEPWDPPGSDPGVRYHDYSIPDPFSPFP